MSTADLQSLSRFAHQLADTARPIALSYFRRSVPVEHKADASPVTVADRETEATLRDMITRRFPEHGIYGEEHGSLHPGRPYTWVIDPIDGTRAFISGMPLFGTLIGLLEHGQPLLGILEVPALGERWEGVRGHPSLMNGQPCQVSHCQSLERAILYSTAPEMFRGEDLGRYQRLVDAVHLRRFGGDCYSYGLLASGHVDLVVEADLAPYDILALVPVIESAGGVVSDWRGRPLGLDGDGRVIAAATPALHRQALAILGA